MRGLKIGCIGLGGNGGEVSVSGRKKANMTNSPFVTPPILPRLSAFIFFTIMAAVRLRKAFRYPEESDGEREELDDEEQEQVIEQLQSQNDARNAQYSMVFTALPLITAVVFVSSVLSASSHFERLFSLLGLVSLLTTAYIMRSSPLQPDRKGKKPMTVRNERMARLHASLVPGTSAVCLLLALVYLSAGSSWGIRPVLYLMPGVMLATILLAQRVMRSVDLTPLKDLQYEYKGA
ncbi:hypothetical protein N7467_002198 [Penicillium canescens]|nr:hypothetical protein N7467_002198 [Penicillium canescens]